jgi:hypothetical protein
MPKKTFTAGEVLSASDVNTFLMDQSVMTFADSTARGSAIGTATEGMLTYLADTNVFEYWDASAYQPLVPVAAQAGLTLIATESFSAVSSHSLGNGTFSSTYKNYRLIYNFLDSTTITHTLRLRASGTDASGANYNTKGLFSGTSAVTNINLAAQTAWASYSAVGRNMLILDILGPNLAQTTLATGVIYADGTGDSRQVSFDHSLTNSYDSLSLIASTGNLSGSVQIFGYKD